MTTEAETGVCSCKPQNSEDGGATPEARRAKEGLCSIQEGAGADTCTLDVQSQNRDCKSLWA